MRSTVILVIVLFTVTVGYHTADSKALFHRRNSRREYNRDSEDMANDIENEFMNMVERFSLDDREDAFFFKPRRYKKRGCIGGCRRDRDCSCGSRQLLRCDIDTKTCVKAYKSFE